MTPILFTFIPRGGSISIPRPTVSSIPTKSSSIISTASTTVMWPASVLKISSITSIIFTFIPINFKVVSYLWNSDFSYYNFYFYHMACYWLILPEFVKSQSLPWYTLGLNSVDFLFWVESFPNIELSLLILTCITLLSLNTTILCLCSFSSFIVKMVGTLSSVLLTS